VHTLARRSASVAAIVWAAVNVSAVRSMNSCGRPPPGQQG
jgi:hypothetical protein